MGALELARSTGVSLYEGDEIRRWIKKIDALEERARKGVAGQKTERSNGRLSPTREPTENSRKRAIYHPHPAD